MTVALFSSGTLPACRLLSLVALLVTLFPFLIQLPGQHQNYQDDSHGNDVKGDITKERDGKKRFSHDPLIPDRLDDAKLRPGKERPLVTPVIIITLGDIPSRICGYF